MTVKGSSKGRSFARPASTLLLLLPLGACVSPFAEPPKPESVAGSPAELGESASVEPSPSKDRHRAEGSKGSGGREKRPDRGPGAPGQQEEVSNTDLALPGGSSVSGGDFVVIGSADDPAGDNGAEDAPYSDVVSIAVADGGAEVRIWVEMAAAIPPKLTGDQVAGVGVDVIRGPDVYQLFASGEPRGWFGYYYAPDGFEEYPGSFAVDGALLVFTIPWEAVGGKGAGEFTGFSDWTGGKAYAEDFAPEVGTGEFDSDG